MNKKFLSKAKQLKPQLTQTLVEIDAKKTSLNEGDSAVFDFGNHYVGSLTVQLTSAGSPQDAPALIKFKFCEIAKELDEDTSTYNGWISKSWLQEELIHVDTLPCVLKLKRRYAFRYVKIQAVGLSSKFSIVINNLTAETVTSAPESIELCGSTERESKIDKIALRTLSECMQYEFEDGPKRDKRLWLGDLRLQALTNYFTFKHNDLVKRCLYLFAGTCGKDGELSQAVFTKPKVVGDDAYMFDYSLLFIPVLQEYYEATGDRQTAEELLPIALKQLTLANANFENNVIKDSDRLGWCFLDWNLALNKQCGAQGVYIYCAKYAVKLMSALGKDTTAIENDIALKTKGAIAHFYDKEKGVFVSGKDRQVSYAANIWMCLAGVLSAAENAKVLDKVKCAENAVGLVTPYAYHYYVQALIDCGKITEARKVINNYWGAMADDGADTFYEMFDPNNPDFSAYGAKAVNSYCHAWSCTPSYFLRKYLTEN
ncbi:MAG: hypothetical protein K2L12_01060 [Clostridia bacterium]|nr:hypothetical protein [Clostridia bacterium]